ncbi:MULTISPECIES: hypothetical protein [unclassified Mesorhizobium]|nr:MULTISPECIES: hypothetical protein [unclassified Mesorhizobium]
MKMAIGAAHAQNECKVKKARPALHADSMKIANRIVFAISSATQIAGDPV